MFGCLCLTTGFADSIPVLLPSKVSRRGVGDLCACTFSSRRIHVTPKI